MGLRFSTTRIKRENLAMGSKSKSNYGTGGWCSKTDCKFKGKKRCESCVVVRGQPSEYEPKKEK